MVKILFRTLGVCGIICLVFRNSADAQSISLSSKDIQEVEQRYEAYQKAIGGGVPQSEIDDICGIVSSTSTCNSSNGSPSDFDAEQCDSACCQIGQKGGDCGVRYGATLGSFNSNLNITNELSKNCRCISNLTEIQGDTDVALPPSGLFPSDQQTNFRNPSIFIYGGGGLTIRCPFNAACRKKCIQEGRPGGRCRGFLRTRCRCD